VTHHYFTSQFPSLKYVSDAVAVTHNSLQHHLSIAKPSETLRRINTVTACIQGGSKITPISQLYRHGERYFGPPRTTVRRPHMFLSLSVFLTPIL